MLNPLKVIITNYPEGTTENMEIINNPEDETQGTRLVPFSREVLLRRRTLSNLEILPSRPRAGGAAKGAYIIKCTGLKKNDAGEIVEAHGTHDPATRSGGPDSDRKVKGTLHWVSAAHALDAEVRLCRQALQ